MNLRVVRETGRPSVEKNTQTKRKRPNMDTKNKFDDTGAAPSTSQNQAQRDSLKESETQQIAKRQSDSIAVLKHALEVREAGSFERYLQSNLEMFQQGIDAKLSQDVWDEVLKTAGYKAVNMRTLSDKVKELASRKGKKARPDTKNTGDSVTPNGDGQP